MSRESSIPEEPIKGGANPLGSDRLVGVVFIEVRYGIERR